uniref:ATP synthase complex subunit 8 n=1 Tax=Lepidocyrtus fimetarius TaxID=2583952 RepID=A0A6G8FEY7_9HEXA|nr:ATP synthase F0 subunit 8 [Lepidocyrtus fimetarius]QIM14968.1 ATP synthase F0 subunit 8 [Lepidocyrtus fimetarius]
MPQMSPIMWLTLFLFFTVMMIILMSKIYFNFLKPEAKNKNDAPKQEMKKNLWAW